MPRTTPKKTTIFAIALNVLVWSLSQGSTPAKEMSIAQESAPQAKVSGDARETFFSNPTKNKQWLPEYKIELKPGEKIRMYIQAGTPDLEQLKMIASLKGRQKEEVVKAYEKWRQDARTLNEEFNEVRKKMSASLIDRMLSKEEPQMDAATKSEDFDLLLKARSMLQKLRSNRLTVWQEVQAKLTEAQLQELDGLKSGRVPENVINTQSAQ